MVAYDVSDAKRRRRIAQVLEGYGERVQYSVFECRVNDTELRTLRSKVLAAAEQDKDCIRWYPLCGPCYVKVIQQGDGGFYLV
jgi:CRISPR-associated protein Cas2